MRSTLSFLSGALEGSLNVFGILACMACISAGAPVVIGPPSCSSDTRRPYRGTWRCRVVASPPPPVTGTKNNKKKITTSKTKLHLNCSRKNIIAIHPQQHTHPVKYIYVPLHFPEIRQKQFWPNRHNIIFFFLVYISIKRGSYWPSSCWIKWAIHGKITRVNAFKLNKQKRHVYSSAAYSSAGKAVPNNVMIGGKRKTCNACVHGRWFHSCFGAMYRCNDQVLRKRYEWTR